MRRQVKIRQSQLRGLPSKVDATEVWAHVDALIAEGWSAKVIARTAKVLDQTVRNRLPGIQRERAQRLLAVNRDALYRAAADTQLVPAIGAVRRIRALQALGWPLEHIGPTRHAAADVLRMEGRADGTIRAARWREIAAAYDRLSMKRGPSDTCRRIGRKASFPLPLCWDDAEIDNPNAAPERRRRPADDRAGEHAERREAVVELIARGYTGNQIADQLGIAQRTVERLSAESREMEESA